MSISGNASGRLVRKPRRPKSRNLRLSAAHEALSQGAVKALGASHFSEPAASTVGWGRGILRGCPFPMCNDGGASSNMLLTEVTATEKMSDIGKQRRGLPSREVKRASKWGSDYRLSLGTRFRSLIFHWCVRVAYIRAGGRHWAPLGRRGTDRTALT